MTTPEFIQNGEPVQGPVVLLTPEGLNIRELLIYLSRNEVRFVRDACNDHIAEFGAFDLLDREMIPEINYKKLLETFVRHIVAEEGRCYVDWMAPRGLSTAESAELKRIGGVT